jgi:putative flavoprotein involved in K+ transport
MGWQYYQYLIRYAEKRKFNITLGVEVTRVAPEYAADRVISGWHVESSEGVNVYPAVIIATGRFGNPYLPQIEGAETFEGRYMHAHDVHDPAEFAGQRIMVVGNGPSGGDIAAALTQAAAKPIFLAVRSDVVLARKYPFGLPHSIWQILISSFPKPIRKPLTNLLVYQGYPGMKDLPIKFAPNRTDRKGTSAPIRGRDLIDALKSGSVVSVAGLARLYGRCAELLDGSRHEVDVVIMCTGYRPVLDFLEIEFDRDPDGWMIREVDPEFGAEGMQIAGYLGLYLVGRFYRGFGALRNFRHEARIAAHQIQRQFNASNDLKLPAQ